jgi:hypothetical protein
VVIARVLGMAAADLAQVAEIAALSWFGAVRRRTLDLSPEWAQKEPMFGQAIARLLRRFRRSRNARRSMPAMILAGC